MSVASGRVAVGSFRGGSTPLAHAVFRAASRNAAAAVPVTPVQPRGQAQVRSAFMASVTTFTYGHQVAEGPRAVKDPHWCCSTAPTYSTMAQCTNNSGPGDAVALVLPCPACSHHNKGRRGVRVVAPGPPVPPHNPSHSPVATVTSTTVPRGLCAYHPLMPINRAVVTKALAPPRLISPLVPTKATVSTHCR